MNILKTYTNKVAKVIFTNMMHSSTFDQLDRLNTRMYAFLAPKDMKLEPGDFVVVDCANGLQIAVFHSYSKNKQDIDIACKYIVSKVDDLSVYNYQR